MIVAWVHVSLSYFIGKTFSRWHLAIAIMSMCICSLQLPIRCALVFCPKQGHKIEAVILNKVCILRIFVLNRVRVLNAQRLTYIHILVEYSPPPTPSHKGISTKATWTFSGLLSQECWPTIHPSPDRRLNGLVLSLLHFPLFFTSSRSLAWAKFINRLQLVGIVIVIVSWGTSNPNLRISGSTAPWQNIV